MKRWLALLGMVLGVLCLPLIVYMAWNWRDQPGFLAIVVGGIVVLCLPLIVWMVWRRSPWQRVLGAVLGASLGAVLGVLGLAVLFRSGMGEAGYVIVFTGGTAGGALGAYLGTWAAGAMVGPRPPTGRHSPRGSG